VKKKQTFSFKPYQ